MSRSSIPRSLRELVLHRDEGRCQYCRLAQFGHGATFHVDHIIPRRRGGPTTAENLALQCPNCSLRKASKIVGADPLDGNQVRLFHPGIQSWEEHFQMQKDATCVGISPTGRATVEALHMNDLFPRVARACQIALGLLKPT